MVFDDFADTDEWVPLREAAAQAGIPEWYIVERLDYYRQHTRLRNGVWEYNLRSVRKAKRDYELYERHRG